MDSSASLSDIRTRYDQPTKLLLCGSHLLLECHFIHIFVVCPFFPENMFAVSDDHPYARRKICFKKIHVISEIMKARGEFPDNLVIK